MTYISAAARGRLASAAMPGACLMMSVSAPVRPLVISDSDPLRMTIARDGRAGADQRGAEAFANRQHRDEHDDDAGDADERDDGGAEPLRNRPDAEQRDGDGLTEPPAHVSFSSRRR